MTRPCTIAIVIAGTCLLTACGGPRKLLLGKYQAGPGAMPGATVELTATQIILTLKDMPQIKYDYKITAENGNKLTLEITGGTVPEKTNLDVTVEKKSITFDPQSFFSAVLQGQWLRS